MLEISTSTCEFWGGHSSTHNILEKDSDKLADGRNIFKTGISIILKNSRRGGWRLGFEEIREPCLG